METLTASRAMAAVQTDAETIRNDETATVGTMSLGDVVRQGDLYLVCIASLPADRKETTNRQLAPGTSQGSRHCVLGGVAVYDADRAQVAALIREAAKADIAAPLIGPVFESATEIEVAHPEHGNRILPPGCYATVYQRLFAEEVRRQVD